MKRVKSETLKSINSSKKPPIFIDLVEDSEEEELEQLEERKHKVSRHAHAASSDISSCFASSASSLLQSSANALILRRRLALLRSRSISLYSQLFTRVKHEAVWCCSGDLH